MKIPQENTYIFTESKLFEFISKIIDAHNDITRKKISKELDNLLKELEAIPKINEKDITDLNKKIEIAGKELLNLAETVKENQKIIDQLKKDNEIHG